MVAFIDRYRDHYGVEPICSQLPIAPSQYYRGPLEWGVRRVLTLGCFAAMLT